MSAAAPLRVLLVDDEALARLRLRTLLGDCTAPPAAWSPASADSEAYIWEIALCFAELIDWRCWFA